MDNLHEYIALSRTPGIPRRSLPQVMARLDSTSMGERDPSMFEGLVNDPREVFNTFTSLCSSDEIIREIHRLKILGVEAISWEDPRYPPDLKQICDPPPVIYVKGQQCLLRETCVAVVGSRKATRYGMRVARQIGKGLASFGVVVVSGMARGIDSAAHRGALDGGGTIAVLGTGIDVVYPKENKDLYHEIANRGLLVSEFPLGSPPEVWHFPCRNRLISALSRGVVVVEAGESSGALITADFALEQGKEVMAVPGNVSSPASSGTNRLIKQGAALVESAEDVAAVLGLTVYFRADPYRSSDEKNASHGHPSFQLTLEQDMILNIVRSGEHDGGMVSVDRIIEASRLPANQVLACLTELELLGLVEAHGEGSYSCP